MTITDFHAHVYPEKVAARAVSSIGEFYQIPMQGDGTVQGLVESGRRGKIGRFVVFSAAASGEQAVKINSYIAQVCAEAAAGIELVGFGTLHPEVQDPAAEIARIEALGLKGVKIHPDMQRFDIDDSRMMDMYACLEGRLIVIFHMGDYRYSWSHPSRLARVLDAFPRLRVVAAHFGGWSLYDLALEYFKDRSCWFDVSSSIPYVGRRRAEELIGIYGAERILFGSDYPMWDPAACLEEFNSLRLTESQRELILCKNAERLLEFTA